MRGPNPKSSLTDMLRGAGGSPFGPQTGSTASLDGILNPQDGMGGPDDGQGPNLGLPPDIAGDLNQSPDQQLHLGQSDTIPAMIHDENGNPKAPARLSSGEYVLPSDIVSHWGDGSNEAGGKVIDRLVKHTRILKSTSKGQQPPMMKNLIHKLFKGVYGKK